MHILTILLDIPQFDNKLQTNFEQTIFHNTVNFLKMIIC
jgi:hypothetical protein